MSICSILNYPPELLLQGSLGACHVAMGLAGPLSRLALSGLSRLGRLLGLVALWVVTVRLLILASLLRRILSLRAVWWALLSRTGSTPVAATPITWSAPPSAVIAHHSESQESQAAQQDQREDTEER